MTPDQLFVIKRLLQMSPEQLAELHSHMEMFESAIDKLNRVMGRSTKSEQLETIAALEAHQKEILNDGCGMTAAERHALIHGVKRFDRNPDTWMTP